MSLPGPRNQAFDPKRTPTRISHAQLIAYSSLAFILIFIIFSFNFFSEPTFRPGDTLLQSAATFGSILLLFPLFFSVLKRSGLTRKPNRWFVFHIVASLVGFVLISIHVSAGSIISAPGLLFFILFFTIYQGIISRIYISRGFSKQFGSREDSFCISKTRKYILGKLIVDKTAVLEKLDKNADEAVFSPNLRHALRHPLLTFKYVILASRESRLVGARSRAGKILSLWRPLHMLMAMVFILGAITHTITVIFFAGYVAGDNTIYWWHLASWGG